MKKQLKTSILAIALLASVTGAFASDISNALSGKKTLVYEWQRKNRNGTNQGTPFTGTENSLLTECPGGTETPCAIGTSEEGPDIVRNYAPLP